MALSGQKFIKHGFSFFLKDESYLKIAIGHKFSACHVDYRFPNNSRSYLNTIARTLNFPCTKIELFYKNESYQDVLYKIVVN